MSAATPQSAAATALQTQASDPALSVWVSANAGSGKTHVLARRVIRLLLRGVEPGRILCLTYTKAAAANMANRVLGELSRWAGLDDAALDQAILAADGGRPGVDRRARARRLFAAALETPGGLKIQTIHAFCGALLHRFPFEAGVPAGFGELDEAGRDELLARVRAELVLAAAARPDSPLGRAFTLIVEALPDGSIDALIAALAGDGGTLEASDDDIARTVGHLSGRSVEAIERLIVDEAAMPSHGWAGLGGALVAAGGNAAARGEALIAAAGAPEPERAALYARVYLKDDGGARAASQFGTAAVRARFPALLAELDRVAALSAELATARAAERGRAARTIGREVVARYEAAKRARGVLDFADLVAAARRLLMDGASAWVHYKLDQGIDHVLVDEAQDTSPEQWDVIRPLVAEFLAGDGAGNGGRPEPRTLFVVGDEKQSIFSFQGADPRRFDAVRAELAAQAADSRFAHVRLRHSFRSAPGILAAVDRVFARVEAHGGLTATPEPTLHEPIHAHLPARVEIWPPEAPQAKADTDAWRRPLDVPAEDDPVSRLGERIASHIRARIAQNFPVARRDKAQPARPGDFLVLVRRRGPLFEAVIRALKSKGVAVAGADRLVVARHIAVLDLLALGDALISVDDELALAAVLKSPLFGFDDGDLIELAARRSGRLAEVLTARAGERPRWREAAERLARLRPAALALRPFDFYARVLGRERGRACMIARLGNEAADALDELLALARAYERVEAPSLPGFLAYVRRAGTEVKRDMEDGRDEVRVMTVHGAKGLEAPYVILADTTRTPPLRFEGGLIKARSPAGRPVLLLSPRKKEDPPAIIAARAAAEAEAAAEYRRLLYVALTRAETSLVLCGAEGAAGRSQGCWYDLVREALETEATEVPAVGFEGTVLAWRADTEAGFAAAPIARGGTAPPQAAQAEPLDDLLAPPPAARPHRRLTPSALGGAALAEPSREEVRRWASDGKAEAARQRGDLIHRLLAGLPSLPPTARPDAGRRLLEAQAALTPDEQDRLLAEVIAVLDRPELAELFAPASLAEVPIAGDLAPEISVAGRIDRLAVGPQRVLFADFKTDAHPPARSENIPEAHRGQIALYAGVLRRLYPDRQIEGLLVYTAGPSIHAFGADELGAVLAGLTSP